MWVVSRSSTSPMGTELQHVARSRAAGGSGDTGTTRGSAWSAPFPGLGCPGPGGTEAPAAGREGRGLQGQAGQGWPSRKGRSVKAFLEVRNIIVRQVVTTGLRSIPSVMGLTRQCWFRGESPRFNKTREEERAGLFDRAMPPSHSSNKRLANPRQRLPTSRAGTDVPRGWTAPSSHRRDTPTPFCLKRSNRASGGWRLGGGTRPEQRPQGRQGAEGPQGRVGLRWALVLGSPEDGGLCDPRSRQVTESSAR